MTTIYVLNGPNLNLLGSREPEIYGRETLADLERMCREEGERLGVGIEFRQTNSEGELIEWLHEAGRDARAAILNAAAYGHVSLALADAVKAIPIPVVEVHLSNVYARESERHRSPLSSAARGGIFGFGALGYRLAIHAAFETSRP